MSDKKKNSNGSLITGLIVGGAVVSVAAMLAAKHKRDQLPENLKQADKPLSFWKKLFLWLLDLIKKKDQ